jgi:hypothetical protein
MSDRVGLERWDSGCTVRAWGQRLAQLRELAQVQHGAFGEAVDPDITISGIEQYHGCPSALSESPQIVDVIIMPCATSLPCGEVDTGSRSEKPQKQRQSAEHNPHELIRMLHDVPLQSFPSSSRCPVLGFLHQRHPGRTAPHTPPPAPLAAM